MNLANSLRIETPKLVSFGHPPMQTDNVGHPIDGIVATRVVDQTRIWRPTDRDNRMAPTHDNIETISENLAYRKHIRDSEFETREVVERETLNQNIENIGTRLDKTRLDDNQITQSVDSSKHSKKHEPEVNPDPEPSSSDSSGHLHQTQEQVNRSVQRRKIVASIRKMTRPTHIRAMILIRPMTFIIDVSDAKIRNTGKRIL